MLRLRPLAVGLLLVFSFASNADAASKFFKVSPSNTWLRTDIEDLSGRPTSVSLASLNVKAGDRIAIRARGKASFKRGNPDSVVEMQAVFRKGRQLVAPGKVGKPAAFVSQRTCQNDIANDVPEDFLVSRSGWTVVQVPDGADNIAFAMADCHWVDNTDANGDFGVEIEKR